MGSAPWLRLVGQRSSYHQYCELKAVQTVHDIVGLSTVYLCKSSFCGVICTLKYLHVCDSKPHPKAC